VPFSFKHPKVLDICRYCGSMALHLACRRFLNPNELMNRRWSCPLCERIEKSVFYNEKSKAITCVSQYIQAANFTSTDQYNLPVKTNPSRLQAGKVYFLTKS